MSDLLSRAVACLDARFGYTKPEPTTLNCGCPDNGPRYVCDCGRTACEQHRSDPHDHAKETADAQ